MESQAHAGVITCLPVLRQQETCGVRRFGGAALDSASSESTLISEKKAPQDWRRPKPSPAAQVRSRRERIGGQIGAVPFD
jgi:hypothetical protein